MSGPVRRGWPDREPLLAKFDSYCPGCGDEILEGDEIHYDSGLGAYVCDWCGGD